MKAKIWLICYGLFVFILLCTICGVVYYVDPYFHYHKPHTEKYFYTLDNQRAQNDGIVKHFDYDALITGTSMAENFKTSEMDAIFGTTSIKAVYSGATYKEINDCLKTALKYNKNIKIIVRSLDMHKFFNDKDLMRYDLGDYPTYLYDSNPINDEQYLFNRNLIMYVVYPMIHKTRYNDHTPGITSFDDYSRWQDYCTFGVNAVLSFDLAEFNMGSDEPYLTDSEKEIIHKNIEQNVTSLAQEYPAVDFYYYFTPFSVVFWQSLIEEGKFYKQLEAEQYIIELILKCDNIHLFSFNNQFDITTDLNNYKDKLHYGGWINSYILYQMREGKCQLTKDNYKSYIQEEKDFYLSYDYDSIKNQEDYENDLIAEDVIKSEIILKHK